MGRDGVVPKNIFRNLDKKHSSPNYNILIVGSWMIAGIVLLAVRTNGFRKTNAMIDF
jgi:amino acid transporter